MKRLKKTIAVFLMTGVLCVTGAAFATPTTLLPQSSHYMGSTSFNIVNEGLSGAIEFAVYDRLGGNEFLNAGFASPGSGRYVYAYQVFSDKAAQGILQYFSVGHENGAAMDVVADSIGTRNDGYSGTDSSKNYFTNSKSKGMWEFKNTSISGGGHSYFMVFSSDKDWVAGVYSMAAPANDEIPLPDTPEPSTLALFGCAGAMVLRKAGLLKSKGR
jgi:hypothetical protein